MNKRNIFILGLLAGGVITCKFREYELSKERKRARKFLKLVKLLNDIICMNEEKLSIDKYFKEKECKKIAIYGMGHLGKALAIMLEHSSIDVLYGIDINAANIKSNLPLITPSEVGESVDVIVVTNIDNYSDIEKLLETKYECPILSVEELIWNCNHMK